METRDMALTPALLHQVQRRIEAAIVPAMARIYGHGRTKPPDEFRPGLKPIERIVSYYDYAACGVSVLAVAAAKGDTQAARLVQVVQNCLDVYRTEIHAHEVPGVGVWSVPLRRVLLHLALAYRVLAPTLGTAERQRYQDLVTEQVPLVIAHCDGFLPGRTDLHLARVNNHTAIFMQGLYYCGRVFDRPEWTAVATDFANRYYASGHEDGYFEEHTNAEREGGPSLVYTPLTAGCLYDVLGGPDQRWPKLVRAGDCFRSLLNEQREMIPLADERTNSAGAWACYGLALHSLTPRGRTFIAESLASFAPESAGPEELAVVHHELDLMTTGSGAVPEYRSDGATRLSLPLGVLRGHGFTAGLSALRSLNRVIAPDSDYALDQQNMVYLAHRQGGVLLTGVKSKRDPGYSTFCMDGDAYTLRTGTLTMGQDWAEARLAYATFEATARWELGPVARLILTADTDRPVVTTLPTGAAVEVSGSTPGEHVRLPGFSPYSQGNQAESVAARRWTWQRQLTLEFAAPR